MKSVPSDKSGVLVTADLAGDMSGDPAGRHRGITVSTAWGVGGAVDGEVAETLVLHPDGTHTLLSEAEAPYRRHLRPEGGIDWLPAAAGAVLGSGERQALRRLAAEVRDRYRPVTGPDGRPLPWDIEFGFVGQKLMLFQIRPLVERGRTLAERLVSELGGGAGAKSATTDLDQPPAAPQAATGHGRCAAGAGTVRGRTQACTG